MPKNYFDQRIARSYEEKWPQLFDAAMIDPCVDFLAELAGSGRAIELGIGTGRIALPLRRRGVEVHGIDLSPEMVAELRAKPGGSDIPVTIGDFATTSVETKFKVAFLLRNTIMNLTSQEGQVSCFETVANLLEPGGVFVIEVIVPALRRLPPGETLHVFATSATHLGFDEFDVANQMSISHHFWFGDGGVETFSAPFRYVWPSELDLMARLAGMSLVSRWSGWDRQPFTSDSTGHVSVWRKPSAGSGTPAGG